MLLACGTAWATEFVCRRMKRNHILVRMQNEIIFVVSDSPEGGFEAHALGASIYTEADSLEELRENVRDAVSCHFDEGLAPSVIRLHIVREEVFAA